MLCRLIAPEWLTNCSKVLEGEFTPDEISELNQKGYNVYYFPNSPKDYIEGSTVDGTQIDQWDFVFVDYDSKSNAYSSQDLFLAEVKRFGLLPTKVVASGNGVHVYWKVTDLDAMSFLRLSRRLMRLLNTDPAVSKICQLMRVPWTLNTKIKDNFKECAIISEENVDYSCERMDQFLPPITVEDEQYCQDHYNKTYDINQTTVKDTIPRQFGKILSENDEVQKIWTGRTEDRSKHDFRLAHILKGYNFTREDTASVLANSAKALERAPRHRSSYAINIVDAVWGFESPNDFKQLSSSVAEILKRSPGDTIKGARFPCNKRIDNTVHGFRLGQVVGLVAGSGVGKTAFAMNMFKWFTEQNPDKHHFFIPLEQPANEIADRWQTMCQGNTSLHDKVQVLSNYDEDGNFRHLSLEEIKQYLLDWQTKTGQKIGCVVIDHIGALKKKGANDEKQDLMTICHSMKAFAVETNTLLIMQSQSSRQKAGIGDLELDKDAAYGTIFFESYCDYLITLWQPLKRCYSNPSCPTTTAFKFCKIRHKKAKQDVIQEDVPYYFYFDSNTELLRDMTQDEIKSFDHFITEATNKRSVDRKTELVEYQSVPYDTYTGATIKGLH